jgi:hypothetical protein
MLGKMVLSVCDEPGHVQFLEYGTTSGTSKWTKGSSIVHSAGHSNEWQWWHPWVVPVVVPVVGGTRGGTRYRWYPWWYPWGSLSMAPHMALAGGHIATRHKHDASLHSD